MLAAQHREFAPPAALAHAVRCFWHERRDDGGAPFDVLPDGYVEVAFCIGAPCALLRGGRWEEVPSPFLVGLLDGPLTLRAAGPLDVLSARCYPWAAYDLLGIASDDAPVRPLGEPLQALQAALARHVAAGAVEAACGLLADRLAGRARAAPDAVAKAGAALRDAYGTLPVSAVAAAAHATVRTLERKFKGSSGRTVKDVAGLMRFERARNRIVWEPAVNLARLAQELGFADQAHLSREFKRYSGIAPAAFARRVRKR